LPDQQIVLGRSNTVYAANQFGYDFGAKVNAAIELLPRAGGTVDATGLYGSQTMTTTIRVGSDSKPVTLILPTGTINIRNGSQFKFYTGSVIIGQGNESDYGTIINDKSPAHATFIYGGSGQPQGVYMAKFAVVSNANRGNGAIAFDLTKVISSSFYDLLARGDDTGYRIGGTWTCACYNRFYNVNAQSQSYGFDFEQTANSNQVFGGLAWGKWGVYGGNGTTSNFFYGLDMESNSVAGAEISNGASNYTFVGTYQEADPGDITLDYGTTGNVIIGGGGPASQL
jgi:hypothetical protein